MTQGFAEIFRNICDEHKLDRSWDIVKKKTWQELVDAIRPGKYAVSRFVADGAECVGLLAEEIAMARNVFLKIVFLEHQTRTGLVFKQDSDTVRKIRRGARLQSICHSRARQSVIPEIFDNSFQVGQIFIAMDLVGGQTLLDYCRGVKDLKDRARCVLIVCRAFQELHESGIVHRDIKPENIKITVDPQDPQKKKVLPAILDWGLATAKSETEKITQHLDCAGTPLYSPPEQLEGKLALADERSDVYSLATLLYVCLAQREPNVRQTPSGPEPHLDMHVGVQDGDKFLAGLPVAAVSIITSCRTYNREDRPRTSELCAKIEAWLNKSDPKQEPAPVAPELSETKPLSKTQRIQLNNPLTKAIVELMEELNK